MTESTTTTSEEPEVKTKTEKVKFYNQHDGLRGRDGGPYLDQVERESAEILRARAEGREPDLEKASAVAGTPLVTINQVPDNTNANPSMSGVTDLDTAISKSMEESASTEEVQELDVTTVDGGSAAEEEPAAPASTSTTTKKTASSTPPADTPTTSSSSSSS